MAMSLLLLTAIFVTQTMFTDQAAASTTLGIDVDATLKDWADGNLSQGTINLIQMGQLMAVNKIRASSDLSSDQKKRVVAYLKNLEELFANGDGSQQSAEQKAEFIAGIRLLAETLDRVGLGDELPVALSEAIDAALNAKNDCHNGQDKDGSRKSQDGDENNAGAKNKTVLTTTTKPPTINKYGHYIFEGEDSIDGDKNNDGDENINDKDCGESNDADKNNNNDKDGQEKDKNHDGDGDNNNADVQNNTASYSSNVAWHSLLTALAVISYTILPMY